MVHQSDNQGTFLLHTQYDLPFDSTLLQTALRFHASEILGNTRSNSLNIDILQHTSTVGAHFNPNWELRVQSLYDRHTLNDQ